MVRGYRFEIGDEVKIPSKFLFGAWVSYGIVQGVRKTRTVPIYTVQIKMRNGLKLTVDIPENEIY